MDCRIQLTSSFLHTVQNELSPTFCLFICLFVFQFYSISNIARYLCRKMLRGRIFDPCFTHEVFRIHKNNIFKDRGMGNPGTLAFRSVHYYSTKTYIPLTSYIETRNSSHHLGSSFHSLIPNPRAACWPGSPLHYPSSGTPALLHVFLMSHWDDCGCHAPPFTLPPHCHQRSRLISTSYPS